MKKILLTGFLSMLALSIAGSANASLINYSDYEMLFNEPITTSANGTPQRLSDVTLNMEIITAEQIKRIGARSIPEILRFIPGVSVRQYAFGQTEVAIRGYNQPNSERILVLLDGRQVYLDSFGQVIWENIPVVIAGIKQIEVIKGPNTALFGFNAVSGVINIVTKDARYDNFSQVSTNFSFGSENLVEGSVAHIAKSNDGKYGLKLAALGYSAKDDFASFKETALHDDPLNPKSKKLILGFEASPVRNLELGVTYRKSDADINEYLITGHKGDNYYRSDSIKGSVAYQGNRNLTNFDVYYNHTDQLLFKGDLFKLDNKIFVTSLNNTFEYGTDHIFRIGGEYRDASNIYEPYDNADLDYNIYSLSGLWSFKVSDKLSTSAAVRYDNFKLSPDGDNVHAGFLGLAGFTQDDFYQRREEIGVNLGTLYKLNDKELVRASYARGVDLPSFTEFGMQMPDAFDGVRYIGNPYTKTSIVSNYELNYERRIHDIDGVFKAAVFYQESKDMQAVGANNSGAAPVLSIVDNLGNSEALGFELSLDGVYKDVWDWSVGYSYVNVNDDFNNKIAGVYRSPVEYENSTPRHKVDMTLGYIAPKWNANFGMQYISSHTDLRLSGVTIYSEDKTNGEFIANAHYSYNVTDNVTWSISGQNILGKTKQYASAEAEPLYWTTLRINF